MEDVGFAFEDGAEEHEEGGEDGCCARGGVGGCGVEGGEDATEIMYM